jgi:hypothetical protein
MLKTAKKAKKGTGVINQKKKEKKKGDGGS